MTDTPEAILDELMKLGDCLEAQLIVHTEGLGPMVTEHLVKRFVSAKGGDTPKKSQ